MGERLGLRQAITRPELPPQSITVTTDAGTTPVIDTQGYSSVAFRSPASAVTTLTFLGSTTETGTYTAIQVEGLDWTMTLSTSKWNTTDASIKGKFPFRWLKATGNAGGVIEMVGTG